MAHTIKTMSKFSEDALEMALKSMSKKDREQFERQCSDILSSLGEKRKKESDTKRSKVSDDYIFETKIVPQITRKISKIEAAEMVGKIRFDIDLKILTNMEEQTDMEDIKKKHEKLVKLENNLQCLILFPQFARGKLYHTLLKTIVIGGKSFKQTVEEELDVSYRTVLRYMAFANMILNFPRLLLCELSFSQIVKHKDRLLKYLDSKEGQSIRDGLSLSIDVVAQGQTLTIEQQDTPNMKKMRFDTGPDWVHHDMMASNEDIPEKNIQSLTCSSKETDEVDDLENFLRSCSMEEKDGIQKNE